ncbi:MAG TPA: hypothetical protein VGO11_25245 [Chthoniobacteraceae bacterium]|jgi:hypothetical protein|nr:hypothetical protein [Chthoniobacteraceae bacterium]
MINLSAADDELVSSAAASPVPQVVGAPPPGAASDQPAPLDRAACEPALAAMRSELEEYGTLLNLLDRQQTAILDRAWETLQTVDHMISAQQQVLRARRTQRGKAVAALTPLEPPRTFSQLVPLIPPAMRPLAEALSMEAARLKKLTARRIQHNERMLARARQFAPR